MATTRFKFRASSVSGKQGTLFIQVIHQRVARQVSTKYKLYSNEWDADSQSVVIRRDTSSERSQYLHIVQETLQRDTSRLQLIILTLDHSRKEYKAEDVLKRFLKKEQSNVFAVFAETLIDKKREEGHRSLATKYQSSLNSLIRFLKGRLLTFEDMDSSLMLSYENYLKDLGRCPNTTSFYMRNLRAIYNQAVEQGLTPQNHPFARVYTGIAKTVSTSRKYRRSRQKNFLLTPQKSFPVTFFCSVSTPAACRRQTLLTC